MKRKWDSLREEANQAFEQKDQANQELKTVSTELYRMADVSYNTSRIINDIDDDFKAATQLSGLDVSFLFFAVALHCTKWILLSHLAPLDFDFSKTSANERMDSATGGRIEKREQREYIKEHGGSRPVKGTHKFYTWDKIITAPVPYDAMEGSERIVIQNFTAYKEAGKRLFGKNHHVATLGHDPILGWVFGPMNITARMITFCDLQNYHVRQIANTNQQEITNKATLVRLIEKSITSWKEDNKRLFASVAKQGMHLASDKNTKMGLQVSFLTPEKAQQLLEKGWNSAEVEKMLNQVVGNLAIVGLQASLSIMINQIIKAMHLLFYNAKEDTYEMYEVKTRKILKWSNCISSGSNVLATLLTQNYRMLDIGGIIATIYRLVSDISFISKIKKEFLEKRWSEIIVGDY